MKVSVHFLEEKFEKFNNLCFSGELPPLPLELSNARSFLGKLLYRKIRGPFGLVCGCSDFRIRISKSYDLTQEELEDVLIHEMIHYHIALRRLRDRGAHGPLFRSMMSDINQRYGRHITVSHKSPPGSPGPLRHSFKPVFVCITELVDTPEPGITVCSAEMARRISRSLGKYYRIASSCWYYGYNEYIDRFPRSRSAKIYRLTRADLALCLEGLKRCDP